MKLLSVTTTAMLRPDLLRRTYASFQKHLKDVDFKYLTLYINVDPAPAGKYTADDVLAVARRFFGTVVSRCSAKPNFTAAINWLWSQADTQFILHLEDDWEMINDTRMADVYRAFDAHPGIYQVRFVGRAQSHKSQRIALAPGVTCRAFYSRVAGKLDESFNPETQLHEVYRWKAWGIASRERCAVMHSSRKGVVLVRDIGRPWAARHQIARRGPKARFTRWV
jgi:hypothetical protein